MSYNVFGGTLNLALSIYRCLLWHIFSCLIEDAVCRVLIIEAVVRVAEVTSGLQTRKCYLVEIVGRTVWFPLTETEISV